MEPGSASAWHLPYPKHTLKSWLPYLFIFLATSPMPLPWISPSIPRTIAFFHALAFLKSFGFQSLALASVSPWETGGNLRFPHPAISRSPLAGLEPTVARLYPRVMALIFHRMSPFEQGGFPLLSRAAPLLCSAPPCSEEGERGPGMESISTSSLFC